MSDNFEQELRRVVTEHALSVLQIARAAIREANTADECRYILDEVIATAKRDILRVVPDDVS